ncbi:hypothetical protein SAMD00079811_74330 [Scytonema sp. HK-05]|nr:hypothetical protein SAMD00079811_74330 [Scytonema sp. HK-05]
MVRGFSTMSGSDLGDHSDRSVGEKLFDLLNLAVHLRSEMTP